MTDTVTLTLLLSNNHIKLRVENFITDKTHEKLLHQNFWENKTQNRVEESNECLVEC
jgi:hypothetical protein